MRRKAPILVAIVGGSGAGKSWLASKLKSRLGLLAGRLSLDSFYRDRSHLSLKRRTAVNFDNPRAIDWPEFHRIMNELRKGNTVAVPRYSFKSHERCGETVLEPRPVWLLDGLWLLHKRSLRRWFALSVFLQCPVTQRLARRLCRDLRSRGRTAESVRSQFEQEVQPMHERYVAPQQRWAQIVLKGNCRPENVQDLARKIRDLATRGSND